MKFPEALKQGDTIGLCGPAFPVGREQLEKSVAALEKLGFSVKVGESLRRAAEAFDRMKEGNETAHLSGGYLETGYLAGTPKERAEELNGMFADPDVRAVLCVRGGYGSAQVMPYLSWPLLRAHPKITAGFSDFTAVVNGIPALCGYGAYHAPMPCSYMTDETHPFSGYSEDCWREALCTDWETISFRNPDGEALSVISGGRAEGRLLGGNVTVFARTTGTFYHPDTDGAILFLEDVDEAVASIDMYLTQMENAGVFRGVRGVLLGNYTDCRNKYRPEYTVQQLLRDRFSERGIPVIGNLRVGHEKPSATLPIGAHCRMDAEHGEISFTRE